MSTSTLKQMAKLYTGTIADDKTLENKTNTPLASFSLPAGKYIITGGYTCTTAFAGKLIRVSIISGGSTVNGTTKRATGDNKGGVNTCAFLTLTETTTVSLQAYQASGSSKTASNIALTAVRLNS